MSILYHYRTALATVAALASIVGSLALLARAAGL